MYTPLNKGEQDYNPWDFSQNPIVLMQLVDNGRLFPIFYLLRSATR